MIYIKDPVRIVNYQAIGELVHRRYSAELSLNQMLGTSKLKADEYRTLLQMSKSVDVENLVLVEEIIIQKSNG